jgi:membrane-bound lytic murein transglycosylase B
VRGARGFGVVGRLAVVALVVALGSTAAWLVTRASTPSPGPVATDIPALSVKPAKVEPGVRAPKVATVADVQPRPSPPPDPQAGTSSTDPLGEWASTVSSATGVPQRALWAYGNAELVMRANDPGCHLSWATLAGIGRVESNHGRFGGAHIQPDGTESKPIVGVPLNGTGKVAEVSDTDHGRMDGDPVHDRAVGPMQFIPSTWRAYASDGNGDRRGDPENIDDAALAAGRYLCVGGRDMATPDGWWSGLMSYNNSALYGRKVFGLADRYGRQAQAAVAGG